MLIQAVVLQTMDGAGTVDCEFWALIGHICGHEGLIDSDRGTIADCLIEIEGRLMITKQGRIDRDCIGRVDYV